MDMDFQQLYNTYFMQVYSFVMTLARNQDMAEEITQKTFFKVVTTRNNYAGGSSQLTWLCAIAKNLYIDTYRKQRQTVPLDDACTADVHLPDTSLADALANEDSALEIHLVLHQLKEPYKEVFQLRVFGELSFQKIGRLFEKSENWARVTYHRARLMIQERMERV